MQHRADDNAQQPLASVLDAMQQTPLVRLDRLTRAYGVSGTILAKLDYLLPGFSKKDRAAKGVIEAAEAAGQLAPGPDRGRVDLWQYGHGPRHCLCHQRI